MDNKELFKRAVEAMDNAYAPFSNFRVGAALLDKDGNVFTGVNVENSSYGGTICAERTACLKAVSEGSREFTKIAVATSEGWGWPCGLCRQFLYEFSPEMLVISGSDEEHLETMTLEELFPKGFRL